MVGLSLRAFCFSAVVPMSCFAARVNIEDVDEGQLNVEDVDEGQSTHQFIRRRRRGVSNLLADGTPYVDVDTPAHFRCGSEYTLGGMGSDRLPDLLTHAHEWCRTDLVPEDRRVPDVLRGLFWMKDLTLADVAFCGSLGEWDAETLTARLPVWSAFVVGKEPEEEVPHLIELVAGQGLSASALLLGRHAMIYSITFTNSSLKEAYISPSHHLFDAISHFPMVELQTTADGSFATERPGDLFIRPSFLLGRPAAPYEAIKVMYDDGTLHMPRVSAMRADHINDQVTYMRYGTTC